jgi:excisionase family DNA binding protein
MLIAVPRPCLAGTAKSLFIMLFIMPIDALKVLHYAVLFCPELAITMTKSASEGEILTIKQVAGYLKVTERTIYRLSAAKKIPAFKVGGMWRFSRADIDSWIKQQSTETLEPAPDKIDSATGKLKHGERK